MDFFMVVFTMIFLAFLASGFYLTVLQELHKRSNGIPIEYNSLQELEKVLKDKLSCSFLQEIELGEKEKINFKCKYDIHTGVIRESKFYIDKSSRKFSGHRDIEEAWYLEKHIRGIFEQNQEDKEKLETKFARYIKVFNISRLIKYAVYVCLLLGVFRYIGGMEFIKSKGVSKMQFTEYSDEITIGEALRAACPKGKWSSDKIDKGLYRVAFNGYGMNGSLLTIVFQAKDWSQCEIQSIAIDGQDYTLFGGLLLEALFANAENGDSGGQIDGLELLEAADENMEEDNFTTDDMEVASEDGVDLSEQPDDLEIAQTVDEEAYDSEVQGFSREDESDFFSNQSDTEIDYVEAYLSIVEDVWNSFDEYCEYTLYDLDGDGIKELITSQGTCQADWSNTVYTLEDGYVSMLGEFFGAVMLYAAEDGNGLYAVSGSMEFQNIDQITKIGNQLYVETIMSGEIGVEDDYYSNDNPVSFTAVTDDSLLRQ